MTVIDNYENARLVGYHKELKKTLKQLKKAEEIIKWYAEDSDMINTGKCFIDCGGKARDYLEGKNK